MRAYSRESSGQLQNLGLKSIANIINKKYTKCRIFLIIQKMQKNTTQFENFKQASSNVKLSISTIYPIELPKIKFYTERAIHDHTQHSRGSPKQIPVTFIRYLKNRQRKRYSSYDEHRLTDQSGKNQRQSMYITNSLQRQKRTVEQILQIDGCRVSTQGNKEAMDLNVLMEKVAVTISKQKEQKSKKLLNYYKKKFLKYKCRKSIDLENRNMHSVRKSNISFLADGLKVQKIQIIETPKADKQIINKAKFNTLANHQINRKNKKWEIGPWKLQAELDAFD